MKTRTRLGLPTFFASFLLSASFCTSASLDNITFSKNQQDTMVEILETLRDVHYRNQQFDDQLSERFLTNYLTTLDPGKAFFTREDVDEFSRFATTFDDQFWKGQINTAADIFNRFRSRATSRLSQSIAWLADKEHPFDFSSAEEIILNNEHLDYVKSPRELDQRWQQRLTNNLITLILDGNSQDEARETLIKRYKTQLTQIEQQDAYDAFEFFTNVMAELYDPHTNYLSPRTVENFKINMNLELEGIGAVLQREDEYTKIMRLVPGGPADRQGGLQPADKIIGVGQGTSGELVDVVGWRLDDVVDLIRGKKGSHVRLQVKRRNAETPKVFTIERGKVKLEEQAAHKDIIFSTNDAGEKVKLGVITLSTFYFGTSRDIYNLLQELKEDKVDGVIVDLRYNGGGSLQEATALTSLFIDHGPVVQIRHSDNKISRHSRSRHPATYRGPLAVLVNRLSASASEIFAGAIQDYGRGIIIGSQSFGKGTVQALTEVKEGELKLTSSKFYRVSGDSTQHRGVIPDVKLPGLFDPSEIGESKYDTALPWDQIVSAPHARYMTLDQARELLQTKHDQRAKESPGFQYINEQITFGLMTANPDKLSLNLTERENRKNHLNNQRLAIENRYRKSQGLPLYKSLDEMEQAFEEAMAQQEKPDSPTDKIILQESAKIVSDWIDFLSTHTPQKLMSFAPCFTCAE